MDLYEIMERFPTHESCIAYLEEVRFANGAYCPKCGSVKVARKVENRPDRVYESGLRTRAKRVIGRWNCYDCPRSFNVLSDTLFSGTKVPLQKWFAAIGLMMNAKKSLSSYQLARDLGLTQPTALHMQHRIRAEMATDNIALLKGIVEADETYVGGKPRKGNKREDGDKDEDKPKRGRGTKKTPVIGAVERGGNVKAQVADDLTGKGVLNFVRNNVNRKGSTLITDEYKAYNAIRGIMPHEVIKHSEQYVDGATHTNTIEGFWSLLKRAWYGSHHKYTGQFTPLFVAEACYKYNHRKRSNVLEHFLKNCFA